MMLALQTSVIARGIYNLSEEYPDIALMLVPR